jgi:hypothetical protein
VVKAQLREVHAPAAHFNNIIARNIKKTFLSTIRRAQFLSTPLIANYWSLVGMKRSAPLDGVKEKRELMVSKQGWT